MSAYAHQMEREFSGLSSRGNSELGSQYVIESGFYMKSFTATIFLASVVTIGVLMMTLLITLSVMLQTCENTNSRTADAHMPMEGVNYCKILALHAELNDLGAAEFPLLCRDVAIRYIKEGEFLKELNFSIRLAESYFGSFGALEDGRDVILMDADHILPSTQQYIALFSARFGTNSDIIREAEQQKQRLTLELYLKLRSKGYSLVLLSRKSEKHRNFTAQQLISAGFSGWTSLIMRTLGCLFQRPDVLHLEPGKLLVSASRRRSACLSVRQFASRTQKLPESEMRGDSREYFSKQRMAITENGLKIAGVIGHHMDALTGPCLGERVFKLPNSLFYNLENHNET